MAVPALPSNLASGDVLTETWVDAVRSLQEFHRDNLPVFYGRHNGTISTASWTTLANSDGFGAWSTAPVINVGFSAGTSGDLGADVPETGVYVVFAQWEFNANTTGIRAGRININGTSFSNWYARNDAMSAGETHLTAWAILNATAADNIELEAYQDSGGNLDLDWALGIVWLNSSTS